MRSMIPRAVLALILLVGAALRAMQFGANVSLSSDEIALALNVIDLGWKDLLFRPLMYDQVAPLGFLALEKATVSILGNHEAAFRLVPFVFSLASLALFWLVARRYLRTSTLLAALLVFALSPALILYAGAAKQYSGDVAITLLLLWMSLRFLEGPVTLSGAVTIGVVGGASLLLSQPAVLVAAGLGALLLVVGLRGGKPALQLVAIGGGWSLGAAIVTYTSLIALSPSTSEYMQGIWKPGFMPVPWAGVEELLWIPERLASAIIYVAAYINSPDSPLRLALVLAYGLLLTLGALHLAKEDARAALVLAVPAIVAVLASMARLLPMSGRITLFLGPLLLIGCFAGFDRIRTWLPARLEGLSTLAALGLAILPGLARLAKQPPPRILGGTRYVFQDVKAHSRPGDRLVLSRGPWARVSAEYYGRRFGLEGWTPIERLRGSHTAEEYLRHYLHELDAFAGEPRVWLYLDGTVPCEDEAMLGYLDAIGERLYSTEFEMNEANQVSAHLYDLSSRERLGRASAETYPVPECKD